MAIPTDYRDIVTGLLTRTEEGKVCWIESAAFFKVLFEKHAFVIWSGQDEETGKEFVACGFEEGGKIIDNFAVDKGDRDFELLQSLWATAKRNARGIAGKLADLKRSLEAGESIGVPF